MRKYCYFIILLLLLQPGFAQQGYFVKQFNTENGLPANGLKGMQWDERSRFLWIATEGGLVRFNGIDFSVYTKENNPFIATERLHFIAKNSKGEIYTADLNGNIFKVDQHSIVFWKKGFEEQKPVYNNTMNLLLQVSNTLLEKKITATDTVSLPFAFNHILPVTDTSTFLLNEKKLYYFSVATTKPIFLKNKQPVNMLFKIGANNFWVSTAKQVYVLTDTAGINNSAAQPIYTKDGGILKTSNTDAQFFWHNGMQAPILIINENAWLLEYKNNSIIAQLICNIVPLNALIRSVQYSHELQVLFVGTDSKGVFVISRNSVNSLTPYTKVAKRRNSYYAQIELSNGNILTNEADVIGSSRQPAAIPANGTFDIYTHLTQDSVLLFSGNNPKTATACLHSYNYKTGERKYYPKIKTQIFTAYTSVQNQVYILTKKELRILKDDDAITVHEMPASSISSLSVNISTLNDSTLIIATCSELLQYNINTNSLRSVFQSNNYCIRALWKYKDYLFFGTYGSGFYILKNGVVKKMPLDNYQYLLYTHCFMPDGNGFCWISTNRGLFKVAIDDMINAYEKNLSGIYYYYFGKTDGMLTNELNGGCAPCALQLKNKLLSFPSMDGLVMINPSIKLPQLPIGNIFIENIASSNRQLSLDSLSIKPLPHTTQELVIKLALAAWCNKENIYIDYQVNNKNWQRLDPLNGFVIQLSSLQSGNYTINIRKRNGFGVNNFTNKQIKFSISTPWYKTGWFYIAAIVLGILFILSIFSVRTRQYKARQSQLETLVSDKTKQLLQKNNELQKTNDIKTRLISIISHDIVTPLKFVTAASKSLTENRSRMSASLQDETLHEITNTTQELQLLSTNILNWIKYQNENRRLSKENIQVATLINDIISVLQSMARQKNISIKNKIVPGLEIVQFYEPIKILVYNLLLNAINFSNKGTINIDGHLSADGFHFSIADEGIGMSAEQVQNLLANEVTINSSSVDKKTGHGLGYLIIKDLLQVTGCTLNINSIKNTGTTVFVFIPNAVLTG
ncbi:MAG: hypothetical protein RLZZ316_428 [Bacteroidota bacterium]